MDRRSFITALLGTAAAMTLDPERILWRPNTKLISIPAALFSDIASQQDIMRSDLPFLYMASSRLWDRIEVRTDFEGFGQPGR